MTDTKTQPLPLLHLIGLLGLVLVLGVALVLLVRKTLMSQPNLEGVTIAGPAALAAMPVTLSNSMARMLADNPALTVADLTFHTHEEGLPANSAHDLFDRQGGGLIWTQTDRSWMENDQPGRWIVTFDGAVEKVGSDQPDLIALLPGVRRDLCDQVNALAAVPVDADNDTAVPRLNASLPLIHRAQATQIPATPTFVIGASGGTPSLKGQPYGCLIDPAHGAVYYHVLYVQ